MNGIMQDIGRGAHRLVAARFTFRRLFLAGLTALLADAVGFAVLMVIDIPVIKDLALTASIGVAVLILTNLILLPVLLSYIGVSAAAAQRSAAAPIATRTAVAASTGLGRRARALHRAALGHRRDRRGRRADDRRLRDQHSARRSATSTRAHPSCGRTRATTATTPSSPATTRCRATLRGDRQDRKGRLPEVPDAGRGRPAGLVAAAGAGRADDRVARPTRCARSPPAATRAAPSG